MGRPKGIAKSGGRKPGAKNKRTIIFGEVLDELRFNIPKEAVRLYRELPPEQKLDCLKFLASYVHPKPTADSHTSLEIASRTVTEFEGCTNEEIVRLCSEQVISPK